MLGRVGFQSPNHSGRVPRTVKKKSSFSQSQDVKLEESYCQNNYCSQASFIPLTPSKRTYHLHFFKLTVPSKAGKELSFARILLMLMKIYVFWIKKQTTKIFFGFFGLKNKLQPISLFGVQGDCEYIFPPSCGKLFKRNGNMLFIDLVSSFYTTLL